MADPTKDHEVDENPREALTPVDPLTRQKYYGSSDPKLEKFEEEITTLINRLSLESRCDVPDFIIAEYLVNCFNAFVVATCQNGEWHSDRD